MNVGLGGAMAIGGALGLLLSKIFPGSNQMLGGVTPAPGADPQVSDTRPLAVGTREQLAGLLTQYNSYLWSQGIRTDWMSAEELTKMAEVPGKYAIPPKKQWARMAYTLKNVVQPLREQLGVPFYLRNGYRPPDYNAAVGGGERSQHIYNSAVDIYLSGEHDTSANRRVLKLAAARIYVNRGRKMKMGFGVYSGNIHVDTGWKHRTWGDAAKYVAEVKNVA